MSSHIQNVAIVGAAGHIGSAFAKSLIQTGKHTVTALTRHDSQSKLPSGVKIARVDYNDQASIAAALEGQQFLVITLSTTAPEDTHARIVAAAADAGVRYVMPNAFGYPIDRAKPIPDNFYYKGVVGRIESVEKSGVTPIILSCGFWYEWSLGLGEPFFGIDIKDRKAYLNDDGERKITVSTWEQCGRALAGLLSLPESGTSPSLADYAGKHVLINSFRVSQRDMLDSVHRVLGTSDADWEIRHESAEKRVQDGLAEMGKGDRRGFGKWLYSGVFVASNEASDYAGSKGVANEVLGLPREDLDEATRRTVDMVKSGWSWSPAS